jgi:hypothetical protein
VKLTDTPVRNDDNAVRKIEDTVFVMNPDTSELHSFNEVGCRMWELADGSRTVAAIAEAIVEEFAVDAQTAQTDALEFLGELNSKDLVRV